MSCFPSRCGAYVEHAPASEWELFNHLSCISILNHPCAFVKAWKLGRVTTLKCQAFGRAGDDVGSESLRPLDRILVMKKSKVDGSRLAQSAL